MEGVGEVLEIGFGTEFRIEFGRVGSPVSLSSAPHLSPCNITTHMVGLAPSERALDVGTDG
jgi:hypothetical protein